MAISSGGHASSPSFSSAVVLDVDVSPHLDTLYISSCFFPPNKRWWTRKLKRKAAHLQSAPSVVPKKPLNTSPVPRQKRFFEGSYNLSPQTSQAQGSSRLSPILPSLTQNRIGFWGSRMSCIRPFNSKTTPTSPGFDICRTPTIFFYSLRFWFFSPQAE